MSLPEFDLQGSLFESLESMAADLFEDSDRYKLLTTKIWPLLALEELARQLAVQERPQFWDLLWERYVESKLDYKSRKHLASTARRSCTSTALTFQGE